MIWCRCLAVNVKQCWRVSSPKHLRPLEGGSLFELIEFVLADPNQRKGEMVVMVRGAAVVVSGIDAEAERVMTVLLGELSTKQASAIGAKLTGVKKSSCTSGRSIAMNNRGLVLGVDDGCLDWWLTGSGRRE